MLGLEGCPGAFQSHNASHDESPKAEWYFSNTLDVCASLWYHFERYAGYEGEADTFSVETDNAKLRYSWLALPSFFASHLCARLRRAFVRFLLRSTPVDETHVSKIQFPVDRFRSLTY